jgi:hypothetical protein
MALPAGREPRLMAGPAVDTRAAAPGVEGQQPRQQAAAEPGHRRADRQPLAAGSAQRAGGQRGQPL